MFTGVFKASAHKPLASSVAREKLTQLLASKPLRGHRFVRQGRIGPFVVDYLCREAGVVIDLALPKTGALPESRRNFLTQMGYRVLQVKPEDLQNPRKLVGLICTACTAIDS
jgi:very-short-patch-repair endonuclease